MAQVLSATHLKLHLPKFCTGPANKKLAIALVNKTQAVLDSPAVYTELGKPVFDEEPPQQIQNDQALIFAPNIAAGMLVYSICGRDSSLVIMWTSDAWNLRVVEGRSSASAVVFKDMFNNGAKIGDDWKVKENTGCYKGVPYLLEASKKGFGSPALKINLSWNARP